MNPYLTHLQSTTRRHFISQAGLGIGSMALASLVGEDATCLASEAMPDAPSSMGKAKSVIYLHMAGSPSQLELFEHKPELRKFHGKECPKKTKCPVRDLFVQGRRQMYTYFNKQNVQTLADTYNN